MSERHYNNPPIQEALVEFRFSEAQDSTVFGKLHERLKSDLPDKTDLPHSDVVVHAESGSVAVKTTFVPRMQFASEYERVRIGPRAMSVHRIRPYPGWDDFSTMIGKVLNAYSEVGDLSFDRVGVRYVNLLEEVERPELFSPAACALEIHGSPPGTFFHQNEYMLDDTTSLILKCAQSEPSSLIIDLDAISKWVAEPVMATVNELHDLVVHAFETTITDRARDTFGEIE